MACNRDLLTALVFWWKVMTTFRHRACVKHRQARRARVIFLRLCFFVCTRASLCSKRFRLVSDQRKTEERDYRFWPREEWNKSQKMKVGGGGGPIPLHEFLFSLTACAGIFFQVKPSARFFLQINIAFFWTVKSHFIISVFVLYKLFYTHNRSKDTGHFLMQNLFENVHTVREE